MIFFGERVFVDIIKLRILRGNHPRLARWALTPMSRILLRDRRGEDKWRRGEGHVKTKSEGIMRQLQENQRMLELHGAGRGRERLAPEDFGKSMVWQTC